MKNSSFNLINEMKPITNIPTEIELYIENALENCPVEVNNVFFQFEDEPSPVELIQDHITVVAADIEFAKPKDTKYVDKQTLLGEKDLDSKQEGSVARKNNQSFNHSFRKESALPKDISSENKNKLWSLEIEELDKQLSSLKITQNQRGSSTKSPTQTPCSKNNVINWKVAKVTSYSQSCAITNFESSLTENKNNLAVQNYTLKIGITALLRTDKGYNDLADQNENTTKTGGSHTELDLQKLQDDLYLLSKRYFTIQLANLYRRLSPTDLLRIYCF